MACNGVPKELSPTVTVSAQSDGCHCTVLQQNLADDQKFTDDHVVGTVVIPRGNRKVADVAVWSSSKAAEQFGWR
jgi:hypothetical protein